MKRIVLCTAKYSDNLGDGVIADSVEYLIKKQGIEEVAHIDISGRLEYAIRKDNSQSVPKRIFLMAPSYLKPLITLIGWHLFFKKRLRARVNEINFARADFLIFGGGQLVSDVAWNFPLKISFICKQARKSGLPYSFNAVGSAKRFSWAARKLFGKVFNSQSLAFLSVRDKQSLENISVLTNSINIFQTVDAGLWAREVYAIEQKPRELGQHIIGIGISHYQELQLHSELGVDRHEKGALAFWTSLYKQLTSKGYKVILFSNGSNDDNTELLRVVSILNKNTEHSINYSIPSNPQELVNVIGNFDSLISHRLHANIIAHSLALPTTALSWDAKVQSYCDLINRSNWCQSDQTNISELINAHLDAISEGIDAQQIEKLKNESEYYLKKQLGQ
jgi:polysaccharide pyruvyl transferase WcaK-like protein